MGDGVESEVRDLEDRRPSQLGPPQERADPGEELLEGEGLGQVVVGSAVEAGHPVGERVAGGQHEDGSADAAAAQSPADGEAVLARQEPVEHDGVVAVGGGQLVADLPGVRDVHHEAFLDEASREHPRGLLVVFDQEQPHRIP